MIKLFPQVSQVVRPLQVKSRVIKALFDLYPPFKERLDRQKHNSVDLDSLKGYTFQLFWNSTDRGRSNPQNKTVMTYNMLLKRRKQSLGRRLSVLLAASEGQQFMSMLRGIAGNIILIQRLQATSIRQLYSTTWERRWLTIQRKILPSCKSQPTFLMYKVFPKRWVCNSSTLNSTHPGVSKQTACIDIQLR